MPETRLQKWLNDHRWSQAKLARRTGLRPEYVNGLCTGKRRNPTLLTIALIMRVTGAPFHSLFDPWSILKRSDA